MDDFEVVLRDSATAATPREQRSPPRWTWIECGSSWAAAEDCGAGFGDTSAAGEVGIILDGVPGLESHC